MFNNLVCYWRRLLKALPVFFFNKKSTACTRLEVPAVLRIQ